MIQRWQRVRPQGRTLFLCACACLLALPAQACEQVAGSMHMGSRYLMESAWTEYASSGKALVREQGTLAGSTLEAGLACGPWSLSASIFTNTGVRAYAGQTSFGSALATHSQIDMQASSISLGWDYTDSFQWVVDASQQHLARQIVGTATVAGYPETYDRELLRMGARWGMASELGRWTLIGMVSVGGAQSMRLQLPGKDATALRFDAPRQWDVGMEWRRDLNQSLYLQAAYHYIATSVEQSPYAIVTSGGSPVAVAYQPQTQTVDQPLTVSLGLRF